VVKYRRLDRHEHERNLTMPGRRETLMRDRLRNSAARKRTHKKTQEHAQTVAATLRQLVEIEKQEKEKV
jgi:hypothetical protein